MSRKVILGSILCMIASMSWGAMFPVADRAFEHLHPFYFSVIRYIGVSMILVVLLLWKEGIRAFRLEGKGKSILVYGTAAFTVYNLLIFFAQEQMGQPGTVAASISESLMPMISILFLWVAVKSKPSMRMLSTIAIALIGALFVITRGELSFLAAFGQQAIPLALMLIAVLGWVVYSIGGERFGDWSTLRYSTLTCLLGTAVSILITVIGSMMNVIPVPTVHDVFAAKYEMAFMILLPGLVALLGWNAGIKMISAENGILFINFVPVTTFAVMAWQGYRISEFEVIGTMLIMAALIKNSMDQRKPALSTPRTIKVKAKENMKAAI